jgi:Uncharacterised MFS-type transporter YbfB
VRLLRHQNRLGRGGCEWAAGGIHPFVSRTAGAACPPSNIAAAAPWLPGETAAIRQAKDEMSELHASIKPAPGQPSDQQLATWRLAAAGLSASLGGIGLARFAYTPLIPALIAAKWFSAADVVYLGAANLAGYLAGALLARVAARRFGPVPSLRAMMVLATLAFFASSAPVSFVWRFLAGLTGSVIMVLAATVVLPHTSPSRRGFVGGVIFAGVGLGQGIATGSQYWVLYGLGAIVGRCWRSRSISALP